MGRYPLLLQAVIHRTPDNHPDNHLLSKVVEDIKQVLRAINLETGKADNALRLKNIHHRLVFKDHDDDDGKLDLLNKDRILIRDGGLKKRSGVDIVEMQVFLFDHMLLLTKTKITGPAPEYRVHKKVGLLPWKLYSV
jgi:hypothetical protein